MPAPLLADAFLSKAQPVTVGWLWEFHIPPKLRPQFSIKVQLLTVGLLFCQLAMPPAHVAALRVNAQRVTVGLPESLYIPPPMLFASE
jgi:hypothetical protein